MKTYPILSSLAAFAVALPAQAHLVTDLEPGTTSSLTGGGAMAALGDSVVYAARVGTEIGLYISDGTAAGTTQIMVLDDVLPLSSPGWFCTVGSDVYFDWGHSSTGTELWKTDGTLGGTVLVKDIRSGGSSSYPGQLANVDGTLYFSAAASSGNSELWKSDGTSASTVLVKDLHPTAGSAPRDICQLGSTSTFLFAATDGVSNGWELWKSDGTTGGTVLVKDIKPGGGGVSSSHPRYLAQFGDKVAFAAAAVGSDYELWLSDGTEVGTTQITVDKFVDSGSSGPRHIVEQNGKLFFQAEGKGLSHGNELWLSDGTSGGTSDLNLYLGGFGSYPFMMTAVGTRYVFFQAFSAFGTELFRTDGTALGTSLYQDLWVGSGSGSPIANRYPSTHLQNSRYAVTSGGVMFFFASTATHGDELWVYDTGTNAASTPRGTACGGLTLSSTEPYLGETCTITTSGIPTTAVLSALALSFTKYTPPIDLTSLGMPGCYQHSGLDSVTFLFGSPTATYGLAIPSSTSWLGAVIQCQSFSFVPGINAAGAISSNGLELEIGDQ